MWKKRILGLILLLLVVGTPVVSQAAGNGTITIENPKQGEVIRGPKITIIWKQLKEGEADHVLLIIDGQRRFPVVENSKQDLTLSLGDHEVTLQALDKNHQPLVEPKTIVKFTLE
ncbi:MAG: hypothetical protein HY202_01775 [Nitrospirae bacterium]|nr:hypothetical protein [Nitrospirota bacterium]